MRKVGLLIDTGVSLALSEAMSRTIRVCSPETEVVIVGSGLAPGLSSDVFLCRLTWDSSVEGGEIPPIYGVCKDVMGTRQWVEAGGGMTMLRVEFPVELFWLPVVWTKRGPLYGEAIGTRSDPSLCYYQPLHLSDRKRQFLYQFSYELLTHFVASPGTYFVQFGMKEGEIEGDFYFDRLWPFPIEPSLASIGVQVPDLLTCHWFCLNDLPIYDLIID